MKVAVVGVPKTIDNDILHMDKTYGFDTAVEEAQRAINSAYIEVTYLAFYVFIFSTMSLYLNYLTIAMWTFLVCA